MGEPLISIVIPVCNGENFLRIAIESCLSQSYKNLEIIVGINPSSDCTVQIANEFSYDSRLIIHEFETYVSMPENFTRSGLLASGDYIKFLCHDDLLPANSISALYSALSSNPTALVSVGYESFIGSGRSTRGASSLGRRKKVSGLVALRRIIRYQNWIGGPSAWLIRKSIFEKRQFMPQYECSFDLEYLTLLASKGSISIAGEVTLFSRVHDGQGSRKCEESGFAFENQEILNSIPDLVDLNLPRKIYLYLYSKLIYLYL